MGFLVADTYTCRPSRQHVLSCGIPVALQRRHKVTASCTGLIRFLGVLGNVAERKCLRQSSRTAPPRQQAGRGWVQTWQGSKREVAGWPPLPRILSSHGCLGRVVSSTPYAAWQQDAVLHATCLVLRAEALQLVHTLVVGVLQGAVRASDVSSKQRLPGQVPGKAADALLLLTVCSCYKRSATGKHGCVCPF